MMCFDFRWSHDPEIVLWCHERAFSTAAPFSFLARTFDELIHRSFPANAAPYRTDYAALTPGELARLLGRV
jgi:hypothetical protein